MRCMVIYGYEVPGGVLNLSSTTLPRPWSPWVLSPFRKNPHSRTGNRTRDLMISSQRLWPLDHEAGRFIRNYQYLISCTSVHWLLTYMQTDRHRKIWKINRWISAIFLCEYAKCNIIQIFTIFMPKLCKTFYKYVYSVCELLSDVNTQSVILWENWKLVG